MIMDALLLFEPVAGTAVTATATSTNILDLANITGVSAITRDIGIGGNFDMKIMVIVNTLFTAAGAATLQVQLQTAPDNGSGLPGSWSNLAMSDAIPKASLVVGYELLRIDMPYGAQRFLQLNYVVATGPFTAGKLNAEMVLDKPEALAYPSGYSNAYL